MALRTLVGQRTYTHLLDRRRVPAAYEVATSRLLYYVEQGMAVRTPVTAWYERWQSASPLRARDWEAFADPAATTYAAYVQRRAEREVHVREVLRGAAEGGDAELADASKAEMARALGVLRFPRHALMMAAGYVGSLAPTGRVTTMKAFQVGDELRHVHRLAERAAQLGDVDAIARASRADWAEGPAWQPLRRLVEELLATYDWGHAFAALDLVVKPMLDAIVGTALAARAQRAGDAVTREVLRSLAEDAAWHRDCAAALAKTAIAQEPHNREVLAGWIEGWTGRALEACAAMAPALGVDADAGRGALRSLAEACGLGGAP
jgi:toluene monooxygenase system protein E